MKNTWPCQNFKINCHFKNYFPVPRRWMLTWLPIKSFFMHLVPNCPAAYKICNKAVRNHRVNKMCSVRLTGSGSRSEIFTHCQGVFWLFLCFIHLYSCVDRGIENILLRMKPWDLYVIAKLILGKEATICFQTRVKHSQFPLKNNVQFSLKLRCQSN